MATAPDANSNQPALEEAKPKKPSRISRRALMLVGAGLGVMSLIVASLLFLLPKNTDIEIIFLANDDFTFGEDCKPVLAGTQSIDDAVQIKFIPEVVPPGETPEFVSVTGRWGLSENDGCLFSGSVSVPRSAETYSVKFAGVFGDKAVGERLLISRDTDEISLSADVTEYVTVTGTLELNVEVSSRTYLNCINNFVFVLGGECGSLRIVDIGQCTGAGGYSDIGSGAVIRISTENDEELGIGRLGEGEGGSILDWEVSGSDSTTTCTFAWSVDVPKVESDYRVGISDRGERSYSYEELEADDWTIGLTLG